MAFFDNRIVDADTPSYVQANLSWEAIAKCAASTKKRKYRYAAEELRTSFTPLMCSTRVFFTVSTLCTRSGWPVALPASGRSHSPSPWRGLISTHNFQSSALWTFASEALAVVSAVSVWRTGQPSALATEHSLCCFPGPYPLTTYSPTQLLFVYYPVHRYM